MTRRRVPALATALAGLLTLASSLTPNLAGREHLLEAVVPGPAQSLAHVAGALGGVALLVLARGVLHGRRRASAAVVAVLLVLAVVHVAKGLDYEEAVIAVMLAAGLAVALRRPARDSASGRALAAGLAVLTAVTGAYAVVVGSLLVGTRPADVVGALTGGLRALAGAVPAGVGSTPREVLEILAAAVVVLAARWSWALIAPTRSWDAHDAEAHRRAAALVAAHGRDPLAPFALRSDKAFFFAHEGLIAYRTLGGTAVVSGDPVAPPGCAPAVVEDFLAFACERGWDVVIASAGPSHLTAYRALGLRTFQVGAEAVVDPRTFSLEGRAVRKVRQSVSRVRKRGWTVEIVSAQVLDATRLADLTAAEEEWQAANPPRPGFSMSMDRLWGAPEDRGDVYVLGRDPDGRVRSFLRFVAYRDGLSLDAMRRLADAPNGLMEALVVAALGHAKERGLGEVSLNFAGFAHIMGGKGPLSRSEQALRWGLGRLHGHFQLERLIQFNDKFSPAWRPRFLVATSRTRLPVAGLRVLQAESYVRAPQRPRPAWGWVPRPVPVLTEASR